MAEVFYRIKGERGYLHKGGLGEDSWRPTAGDAVVYGIHKFALMRRDEIRSAYDPTARAVKTRVRRSRHADAWCGNLRFDDYGYSKAHVSQPQRGHWIYSICQQADYWEDSSIGYATEDAAKAAADAYLRKRGWVLA